MARPLPCRADKEWKSKQRAESNWLKGQTSLLHRERERERGRGQLTVSWTSSRPACRQAGDKQLACLLEESWLRGGSVSLSDQLVVYWCLAPSVVRLLKNEGGNHWTPARKREKLCPPLASSTAIPEVSASSPTLHQGCPSPRTPRRCQHSSGNFDEKF